MKNKNHICKYSTVHDRLSDNRLSDDRLSSQPKFGANGPNLTIYSGLALRIRLKYNDLFMDCPDFIKVLVITI